MTSDLNDQSLDQMMSTSITLAAHASAFLMEGFYVLADAATGVPIDFFNPATPGRR
jgi:hypothetical protein